jgi:hypothetical protein
MAAHGETVAFGEGDDPVGDGEILHPRPVAHRLPFHLVLGDQRPALLRNQPGEVVMRGNLACGDAAAIEDAPGAREVAQRRQRRMFRPGTRRKQRGNRTGDGLAAGQNGFTTTSTTMAISSTVGTSLTMR